MSARLVRWAGAALICATAFASSADAVPDRFDDLKQMLEAVRTTKASNSDRDAGPELTPVKLAFRRWVEAQLPPTSKPGRIEGTIVTPDPMSLSSLARQMNDALDKAQLTCGNFESDSYRCSGAPDNQQTERGYVGHLQLGLLDGGRYLLVVTSVGVLCGEDESAYLYKPGASGWKLVFASEQDDYRKGHYSVQNFTEIAVSPWAGEGHADTPPLVATLGYGPWCSSTWSALITRLWRMSPASVSPKPLIDRTDGLWWGDDDFGNATLTATDFLVQRVDRSIDDGVHHRMHVRHYRIGPGDRIQRVDPVALRPMDLVDEWLISDWNDAATWLERRTDRAEALRAHRKFKPYHRLYSFDGTKRCRADKTLWQVALSREADEPSDHSPSWTLYFMVRWTAPYVFRLASVSSRSNRDCDIADPSGEEGAKLFPDTQWHPRP